MHIWKLWKKYFLPVILPTLILLVILGGWVSFYLKHGQLNKQPLSELSVLNYEQADLQFRAPRPDTLNLPTPPAVEIVQTPSPTPVPEKNNSQAANILMYHYIRDGVDPRRDSLGYRLSVTPQDFENELADFQKKGYISLTMSELMVAPQLAGSIILTFDDGYADFYSNAFPLLQKYNCKATVYVITGKIGQKGYLTWEQIEELQKAGVEIGAHTVTHPDLSKLSRERQWQEINGSKEVLESRLGTKIASFCYPSGKYTAETLELVKQAGFTNATTTRPGSVNSLENPYTIPRLRISPSLNLAALEKSLAG